MIGFSRPKSLFLFDAISPIVPTRFDEIKHLSIIFIEVRVIIFEISLLNIEVLKGEVIPATRSRRGRLIKHFAFARQISPVP
jgi:hypothetical protein